MGEEAAELVRHDLVKRHQKLCAGRSEAAQVLDCVVGVTVATQRLGGVDLQQSQRHDAALIQGV